MIQGAENGRPVLRNRGGGGSRALSEDGSVTSMESGPSSFVHFPAVPTYYEMHRELNLNGSTSEAVHGLPQGARRQARIRR